MTSIDPLNDTDFEGYVIPSYALFLSMALQYMQPWTEIFTVTSRIVLYFAMPLAWVATQSKRPAARLLYLILMLPWLIKCTTESIPSIETYCSLSAILSILPTYMFVFRQMFYRNKFLSYQEKFYSCVLVFGGILLSIVYTMEKQQIYAIQQSFPFISAREAFGIPAAEKIIRDTTYTYIQKAIYLFFRSILFPLTNHLYIVLILLLVKMMFTRKIH